MNSIKTYLLFFIVCFVVTTSKGQMPDWGEPDTLAHHKLGPGIQYSNIYFTGKKMLIWVTEVDLTHPLNKIEQVQSNHKVPDLVRWTVQEHYKQNSYPGHKVCVAFNHDFFSYDGGICIGLNISEGEIPYGGGWGRSLLAINAEKKAGVFNPLLNAKVILPDASELKIDFFNSSADGLAGDCILFNRFNARQLTDAGKYIKLSPKGAWTVNGDDIPCEVLEISDIPIQSSQTEYILYLRGAKINAMNSVKVGDMIRILQKFKTGTFGQPIQEILNAFHGYPSIAFEGKLHEGEYNNFENGREYEVSSRVMVGTSQDGNTLYVVSTEMSKSSAGVNCIDLANYMLATGSWNVVNFDSGGSVAIVVDEEMLNYPARDAIRPVMDALLAVSTAPESNQVASYSFITPSIYPSAASSVKLELLGYNEFDEIVEKNVKGFSFTCVPSDIGYIDENQVFHLSVNATKGKVIASKNGKQTELIVNVRTVENISFNPTKILIDKRNYPINVETKIDNTVYQISPSSLKWSVENPTVCKVSDGVLSGIDNGETIVTGVFGALVRTLDVVVEIGEDSKKISTFSELDSFSQKSSGVSNIGFENKGSITIMNFETIAGRAPFIELTKDVVFYGLPDSLTWSFVSSENIFKDFIFTFEDALGNSITHKIDNFVSGKNMILIPFSTDKVPWNVSKFPIKFKKVKFNLNSLATKHYSISFDDLFAHYPQKSNTNLINISNENQITLFIQNGKLILKNNNVSDKEITVELFSLQGQKIKSVTISNSNQVDLPINNIENGVYLLRILTDKREFMEKILIGK